MFDASWADASSETVAQRRSRKNGVKRGGTPVPQRASLQSSKSSGSSTKSQIKPSLVNRIGSSKQSEPLPLPMRRPHNKHDSLTPAPISTMDYNGKSSLSYSIPRPDSFILDDASILGCTCCSVQDHESTTGTIFSAAPSVDDSVFSAWMDRSITAESSWCGSVIDCPGITTEIQHLSPTSYVTRTTEVVFSSAQDIDPACRIFNEICISSDGMLMEDDENDKELHQITPMSDSDDLRPPLRIHTFIENRQSPMSSPRSPAIKTPNLRKKLSLRTMRSPVGSPTHPMSRNNAPEIAPVTIRHETWKAPESWECPTDISRLLPYSEAESLSFETSCSPIEPEITHLDRHILNMTAANPTIMLERLKEQWPDTVDSSVSQDLKVEKELWMLMSLRYLTDRANGENDIKLEDASNTMPQSPKNKILSLHENQASASILTALNPTSQIHHLSTDSTKLNSTRYYPITVPKPISTLPYATASFQKIHSINLPTLLQTPQIPALLKECYRVLSTTGSIHLTLLSPSPTTSTTGPKLRLWLEEHLLPNIEAQFRCTQPSRLLPTWLLDAGFDLSNAKSRIRPVRFWALGPGEGGKWDRDGWNESSKGINGLIAVVGRMLWKDFYGEFVRGNQWWWEDGGIVEECGRLGTRWDCEVLDVFKKEV